MNGLKGEKGEPGDASVGFSLRVSVLQAVGGRGEGDTQTRTPGPPGSGPRAHRWEPL